MPGQPRNSVPEPSRSHQTSRKREPERNKFIFPMVRKEKLLPKALTPAEVTQLFTTGNQLYIPKPLARSREISAADKLVYSCVYASAGTSDICRESGETVGRRLGKRGSRAAQLHWLQRHNSKLRKLKLLKNLPCGPKTIDRQFLKHQIFGHAEPEQGQPFSVFEEMKLNAYALPAELARYPLTDGGKTLAAVLGAYGTKSGKSFPSQRRIARDLGCSVKSVKRYTRELERKGVIRVGKERKSDGTGRWHNVYVFLYLDVYAPRFAKDQPLLTPIDQPVLSPKEELLKRNFFKNGAHTPTPSSSCATAEPKSAATPRKPTTTNARISEPLRKELPHLLVRYGLGALTKKQFSEVEASIMGLADPELAVQILLEEYLQPARLSRFGHAGGVADAVRNEFCVMWPDRLREIIAALDHGNGNGNGKASETPFSPKQVELYLARNAATLRQREGFEQIATSLEKLAANAAVHLDLTKLEDVLSTLEDKMFVIAETRISEEQMLRARRDVESTLRTYGGKMTHQQLAFLEKQHLKGWLLVEIGLPRLSLFYLR